VLRDPDGTIRHWSVGSERLFGFTAAEATGRLSHELLGTRFPDGGRRTAQEELLRTGEWRGELRHRGRGGQAVVVASH
jgi:PAS domain-containing protein